MPGAITHLKAAYLYNEKVGVQDEGLLYLGSISPDSVNISGHADREIRWPAHLRSSDLDVWLNNAELFYKQNIKRYNKSYLLGYILHIVTDIVWDMEFDKPLFFVMNKSGIAKEELKKARWAELDGYEKRQQSTDWYYNVIRKLESAAASDISTLSAENINIWRQMVIERKFDENATSRFINDEIMNSFFDSVIQKMQEITDEKIDFL